MKGALVIGAAGVAILGACTRPLVFEGYSGQRSGRQVAIIRPAGGNDITEIDDRHLPPDVPQGAAIVEVLPGEHRFMVEMGWSRNARGSSFSTEGRATVEAGRCYQPILDCPNVWHHCRADLQPTACPSTWFARRQEARVWRPFEDHDWPECHPAEVPAAFPDSSEACAVSDDPHDHGPETCVPDPSRGPEIAYDEALGVRVFRACVRPIEHGERGPVRLDRHRLLIERTGPGTFGGRNSLVRFVSKLTERLGKSDLDVRRFTTGECPETGGPNPDAGSWCVVVELASAEVDLPKLMRAFTSLYVDAPPGCVPMVVELGVPEPCPEHLMLDAR